MIPYVEGVSHDVRRVLAPLGISTAMQSQNVKWSAMAGTKDKVPAEENPGVVYAVGCKDCRAIYIGKTGRSASQKIKEDKYQPRNGQVEKSTIPEHAHLEGHSIHWAPTIIERETNGKRRKVKEALHIHRMGKRQCSMNQDIGQQMTRIWLDVLS